MSHYTQRIAKSGAFVRKKASNTPPEDNGVAFDPMNSINKARNLRGQSVRGKNVQGR